MQQHPKQKGSILVVSKLRHCKVTQSHISDAHATQVVCVLMQHKQRVQSALTPSSFLHITAQQQSTFAMHVLQLQ